jgi:cell division protein FtsQ
MRQIVPEIAPDEIRPGRRPRKRPQSTPRARSRTETPKGPGPSKLAYRLSRAWAKPMLRSGVLVYLPLLILGVVGWRVAAHDDWRGRIEAEIGALAHRIAARPEFAVRGVSVLGGGEDLQRQVRGALGIARGVSSLTLDVEALRHRVEALGAVKKATVQFDPQGTLRVSVVERIPEVLYRRPDNQLVMLDQGGVEVGSAGKRADHPELPVIVGAGAPEHVDEVIELLTAAPDLMPRLRAFVRVGERRWDIHLDRDMVIMLPAEGSVEALSRVMALQYGDELLDRDLAAIDMRLPQRPTLRMSAEAAETYQIRRAVTAIGGEDT